VIVPSYFSNLAENQNLQFLLDSAQLSLEQKSIWRDWLNLGLPQMSLSFDTAIGRERIAAAASIVDSDAPAPLRSRPKLELLKGKIPAIKEKFRMNQDDMRTLEVLRALPLGGNNNQALINFLNSDLQMAAVSGDKRVDLMLLQAISTLKIDVNTTNNPDGVAYGLIDLLAASYQAQGVPIVWTSSTTAKPITDIDNFLQINWNTRGRQFGRIVMSYELWQVFKKTTEVSDMLKSFFNIGKTNGTFANTLANVNDMFSANGWPAIEVINHVTNIEVDGVPSYIKGFNSNNVSFLPAGKIGTLYNAVSMEKIHPVKDKSYADFGPTLVSKWAESDPLVEFTGMEMNAFPGVDVDNIYLLETDTVQASFV
jgi:Phage major capsid protein E